MSIGRLKGGERSGLKTKQCQFSIRKDGSETIRRRPLKAICVTKTSSALHHRATTREVKYAAKVVFANRRKFLPVRAECRPPNLRSGSPENVARVAAHGIPNVYRATTLAGQKGTAIRTPDHAPDAVSEGRRDFPDQFAIPAAINA